MKAELSPAADADEEIPALIKTLLAAEQRLVELTAGEVDAVVDEEGRTFLLRRAQEQLRESEANKQAAILNALPAHIALLDAQGVIVSVNEAWRRFGADNALQGPGYGIGLNYVETCEHVSGSEAAEARQVAAGIRAVMGGRKKSFSIEYPCHSPEEQRWFLLTVTPLSSDAPHGGAVIMHLNITERRQADESLRASEERFRQIADTIQEVFWMTDVEKNQMIYVSPGYEKIWGRTCASLYAAPSEWIESIYPEDRDRVLAAAMAKQVAGTYDETYRILRPDGALRWIRDRAFPVKDSRGEAWRVVGVAEDITERKQLEEQSFRAQRLESVGLLAAGISHDLNNVLAPIGMAVSLLRSKLTASGDLRLLDILEKSGERGAGLVRQIIGFVQGSSGEARLVQVTHLLQDISGIITETFPKSIVLQQEVPNDLWPVMANPTQIHQVLLNLCVNARDAMPHGGTLTLRAENCLLDVMAAQAIEGAAPGPWLMLQVGDTGSGIPPEVLARIWDPFFTTKAAGHGTGLGLSTVRGIVETYHGFTTLQTETGRGTNIRVYLPVSSSSVASDGTASPQPLMRGQGELILLVDDEQAIRDIANAILTRAGYRVIMAADGREALEIFEAHSAGIALVITDLDMPRLGGTAMADALRAIKPSLIILAMSGISSRYTGEKPCNFASAFMSKPFTVEALLGHVSRLVSGHSNPPPTPRPDHATAE